jgi:hypothetical protein
MKQFLLMLLVLLNVGFCQAQSQKVKPKPTTKPAGQTPPTAPPKPTQPEQMEKKKDSVPKSKGIKSREPIDPFPMEKELRNGAAKRKDSIKN